MSNHNSTRDRPRPRGSGRRLGSTREAYDEMNQADDLFLMKVIAARIDQPSDSSNNSRSNHQQQQQFHRRDSDREQDAFLRGLQETTPPYGAASANRQTPPPRRSNNNPAVDNQSTHSSSRRSIRIADVNFEDPFVRKVVLERGTHHMRSDAYDRHKAQIELGRHGQQAHHHRHYFTEPHQRQIEIHPMESVQQQQQRPTTECVKEGTLNYLYDQKYATEEPGAPSRSPSEPGAYANAQLRSLPSQVSSDHSQPGAYAETPRTRLVHALSTGDDEEWETLPPELTSNDGTNNEEAANADQAVFTAEVSVAADFNNKKAEGSKSRPLMKSTTCIVATMIGLIVSATAIVIGVLFALKNQEESPRETEPTLAPTLTKPETIDAFMSSLPPQTVATIEKDPTSPQAQAFDWLVEDVNFVSYPIWRLQQRFALATIYNSLQWKGSSSSSSTDSSSSNNNKNEPHTWLHYDKSECEWVPHANPDKACNRQTGKYQHLALQYLSLMGGDDHEVGHPADAGIEMPPEVSLLTSLETMSLKDFVMPFNVTISNLLPPTLHELSQLQTLCLVNLQLSGTVPSKLGVLGSLIDLDLNGNDIRGSIPSELGQLEQLRTLFLEENQLSGSLPSELGLLSNLEYLYMQDNNIKGSLATEIGTLTSLSFWKAQGNSLTGSVPSEVGLLTNLIALQWDDNQMTGSLPNEVQSLTDLTDLGLFGNQITGRVPKELCALRPQPRMEVNCSVIVCCGKSRLD